MIGLSSFDNLLLFTTEYYWIYFDVRELWPDITFWVDVQGLAIADRRADRDSCTGIIPKLRINSSIQELTKICVIWNIFGNY